VVSIEKDLGGTTVFNLVHFPLDAEGRSAVAMAVTSANPSGLVLPIAKTGPVCDVNSSTDTTDLLDLSLGDPSWNLPGEEMFEIPIDGPLLDGPLDGPFDGPSFDGPLDPPIPPFPPEPPEPPMPPEPPGPDAPTPGLPGQPGPAPNEGQPNPDKKPPTTPPPGQPTQPPGPSLPTQQNPQKLDGLWDLRFQERYDIQQEDGKDHAGNVFYFPPFSGIPYDPAKLTEGQWEVKFFERVKEFWHVPTGSTEYKYAPEVEDVPTVAYMGLNAKTESFPNGISSTGNGVKNAAAGTPYPPWNTYTAFSYIRNLEMRRSGTGDPWQPYAPP
jgi:hypothetical protein